MQLFPAPVGTYILSVKNPDERICVVGFAHVQGNRVDPMTLIAFGGLTPDHGILHPDGSVTYRANNVVFASEDDWRTEMDTSSLVEESEATPDTVPINWDTKTYKTKSYWVWHTATAVFELDGNVPYPNDSRILKIKRDEFYEFKRTGYVEMDPHTGLIAPDKPSEEPSADAAPAEAGDDDDDTADLI